MNAHSPDRLARSPPLLPALATAALTFALWADDTRTIRIVSLIGPVCGYHMRLLLSQFQPCLSKWLFIFLSY